MKYENKRFSVGLTGKAYADGWERTFGGKKGAPNACADCGASDKGDRPNCYCVMSDEDLASD
ncbi:MAG: hypothetical protein M3R04_02470 [bacterium]|nr:hypothetical protein [bacterium]